MCETRRQTKYIVGESYNTWMMQCTDSGGSRCLISVKNVVKPARLRFYWTEDQKTSWLSCRCLCVYVIGSCGSVEMRPLR